MSTGIGCSLIKGVGQDCLEKQLMDSGHPTTWFLGGTAKMSIHRPFTPRPMLLVFYRGFQGLEDEI
jgi:hypothetical protein